MKLVDLIAESKNADLFHGTSAEKAEQILQTNVLRARAPVAPHLRQYVRGPNKFKTGDFKTVSLSRSLSAARSFASGRVSRTGIAGVVFVVDQMKLWQSVGKRMTSYNDLYGDDPTGSKGRSTEYEETVVGDIANFDKFIDRIYVYVHPQHKDLVDPITFPTLLAHPKLQLVVNKTSTHNNPVIHQYDRFDTARQFDRTAQRLASTEVGTPQ